MHRHRLNTQDQITAEIVRELLDYDPDTGLFTWKWRERKWFARECDFWMRGTPGTQGSGLSLRADRRNILVELFCRSLPIVSPSCG